ncbi:MAG: M36 family metallopeptidase [Acidobacteria bacterium]|nr:M36 family metallopeptidase [Acidobacteriota bacterium]
MKRLSIILTSLLSISLLSSIILSISAQQQDRPSSEPTSQRADEPRGRTEQDAFKDFDIRAEVERSLDQLDTERLAIRKRPIRISNGRASKLMRERPRTQIRWSSLTYAPSRLVNLEEGLSAPAQGSSADIARRFLRDNRDLFRLRDDEIDSLGIARSDRSAHNGMTHVRLQQRIDGLEVFQAEYSLHIAATGAVVAADGELMPAAGEIANAAGARLSADEALRRAAGSVGHQIKGELSLAAAPSGREQKQKFKASGGGDIFAHEAESRLVYFPVSQDQIRLSWEITVWMKDSPDAYLMLIDAATGSLLYRYNLTWFCFDDATENSAFYSGSGMAGGRLPAARNRFSPAIPQSGAAPHGLVFNMESPRPNVPVSSSSPPTIERIDVPFQSSPFLGTTIFQSGDPHFDWWNGQPQTGLTTNNTDTYLDRDSNNIPDDTTDNPRLSVTDGNFSFPLDLTLQPTTKDNQRSAQVNLFYWVNRYHDILYHFGFTEASGNFQTNNFGLGGIGGDPIRAEAQDGSGVNNANYSGSRDGSLARVQMYLWSGNPQLDGDFDQGIIIHELTHGLSTRLVGNGQGLTGLQGRGMGEGWSDYFGLVLLREADDDLNGNYAVGQYAISNYSRGIRRYPYSTNQQIYPLNYGDISLNTAVHPVGEIWCNTLMEMRAALITRNGYQEGQRQSIQLVVDGLKLTPLAPSFLDARNAILMADQINNNGANQCEIWQSFSKHGMGFSAETLGTNDGNPIESFDMPPFCSNLGTIRFNRKSYLNGETIAISVGDRNAAGPLQVQIRSSVTNDQETLVLTRDALYNGNYLAGIQLAGGQAIPGDGKLQASLRLQDQIIVTYNDADNGNGSAVQTIETTRVGGEKPVFEDDVETGNRGWSAIGTPVNNWMITEQKAASFKRSWTDSPNGNYADMQDTSLVSPLFDFSSADSVMFYFAHSYAFEADFDYGMIEISSDDGANWTRVAAFSGIQTSFLRQHIQIDSLAGQKQARIRFRIRSDENLNFDGWSLDDIKVVVRSSDLNFIPPPDSLAPVVLSVSPAAGPPAGNTLVTIEGLNFTDDNDLKVFFDGVATTNVQVMSGTVIKAMSPAHAAGTVGIQIQTRYGTAAIASAFTYYQSGSQASTPEVLSSFPMSGTKTGGTVVTINGNNFTPETTVKFGTQSATVGFINPNMISAVTPASPTTGPADLQISNTVDLKITVPNGFLYVEPTPPTGQIFNPNGGEKLYSGSTYTVSWNSADNRRVQRHKLALKPFNSPGTIQIADYVEGSAQSFNWAIPLDTPSSALYRLQLTIVDDEGAETVIESAADFAIERRWESLTSTNISVQRPIAGSDGNHLYLFGGRVTSSSSSTISTVQRFDPSARTWSTSDAAPMMTGLNAGKAAFLNGKFYIPGGINQQIQISSVHQEYDVASNTWKTLAPAPVPLFLYALAVDSGSGIIYKTGGLDDLAVSDFHIFNTMSGQWSILPSMPTARFAHESVLFNGKIYVAAGSGVQGGLLNCEVFDIATNKWSSIAKISITRHYGMSTLATGSDGKAYWLLIGGEDPATGDPLSSIEAFDFAENRWIVLDSSFNLPTARTRLGGAVLDGAVYAMAGAIPSSSGTSNVRMVERMAISQFDLVSPNQPPIVIVPAGDQIGVAGNVVTFGVSAQDLGSSIPVQISATGMPEDASFTYNNDGNNSGKGTFTWTPVPSDTGQSSLINFTASDGELTETKSVLIRVVNAGQSTSVNAADFRLGPLAANSIAAVFGTDLAVRTESARSNPLPYALAETRATISGLPVPLFFVSPNQINFVVPPLLPPGPATMVISSPQGKWSVSQMNIAPAAPAIFTANATGRGDATALATVDGITYQQSPFDVNVNGQPNILVLYGTGFRNAPAADPFDGNGIAEALQATIDGLPATVLYAGAQGSFSGLDQINLIIPQGLAGTGQRRVEIRISINGVEANLVSILIR